MYKSKEIRNWAINKGIIAHGTKIAQAIKTCEESVELSQAVLKDDIEEIKDALGDIYVTILIQAEMNGITLEECIDRAWNEIKDRKGKMVAGGFFVKES